MNTNTISINAPAQEEAIASPKENVLQNTAHLQGGYFLIGKTSPTNIFLSEEFTEEQQMIADMVEEFCTKELQEPYYSKGYEIDVRKEADKQKVIELLEKAGGMGLCGVAIEEEYGGLDLDFNTGLIFSEKIALGLSFATTIGAQTSIGSLPIVYYGTKSQKEKYLPGIATGKSKAAYCLTEPTAGSDANSGKTRAKLSSDGKHYLLNGQKIWITNGGIADLFIVFAKIDTDENLSAFIVEKAFGGIEIGAEERKMGIKGSSTVPLFFDNCPVPVENLLSERAGGLKIALNILNTGRIKLGAGTIGGSKFALTRSIRYAKERKQFGQSISDFGAIKYKIGEITTRSFACDAALYRTGRNIDLKTEAYKDSGRSASEAKLKAIQEFAIECAILKVKGSELADYSTDQGIQIFGGMGYSAEVGMEMGYRDARITRIYEGTNEINRMLSVAELTKRALKTKELDLVGAGKKIPSHILRKLLPFQNKSGLSAGYDLVQGIKDTFLLLSGAAGKKLGRKIEAEQEIIMNLADILAEAYICESVLLKVEKLQTTNLGEAEKLPIQFAMMQLYLYEASDLVRKAAKDAIGSFATGFQKRMLNFMVKKLLGNFEVNPKDLRRKVADFVIEKEEYGF